MKKRKKLLSFLLAAVMTFSSIPSTAVDAATTIEWGTKPEDGVTDDQPFAPGTGGSANFRIPCLTTLDDGTLVAACDARWNHGSDACGLDTIVSYSKDNGATWNYTFANYLGDNGNKFSYQSTAFIDPAIASDGENVYMIADLYPAGIAINTTPDTHRPLTGSTGFDANDNLILAKSTDTVDGLSATAERIKQPFDYHLEKIEGAAENAESYYLLKDKSGKTVEGYTIDAYFNIKGSGVDTNLFVGDSPYYPWPADYLYMTKSADGGKTWSAPSLLNLKKDTEQTLLVGPGRGICTSTGRIIFTCYEFTSGDRNSACIYSDDGGKTWTRGASVSKTTSEAVVTEADGRLYMFARHDRLYFVSEDWGETWSEGKNAPVAYNGGCQLTATTYSKKIDGKTAILFAAPSNTSSRSAGKIFVILVQDDGSLQWKYEYSVNGSDSYAYSCITEQQDGSIGLLYETNGTHIVYENIAIRDIVGKGAIGDLWLTDAKDTVGRIEMKPNETVTYTLNGTESNAKAAADIKAVSSNEKIATVSVSGLNVTVKTAANISGLGEADITITAGDKEVVIPLRATAAEKYEVVELAMGETKTYKDTTGYYGDADLSSLDKTVASVTLTGEDPNASEAAAQSIALYAEEGAETQETVQKGQLATAVANFNGEYVDLADCEYTFTAVVDKENQYKVTGTTANGTTVYLNMKNYGQRPHETEEAVIEVLAGSTEGTVKLKDITNGKHLHFGKEAGNLCFDRCGNSCGTKDEMQLYKKLESATTSPIKGYEKVTEVKAGEKYLIAALAEDGSYYVLKPTSGQEKYNHVAKVVAYTDETNPGTGETNPGTGETNPTDPTTAASLKAILATAAGQFNGEYVNAAEYLYTFAAAGTSGQYTVSAKDSDGTTVYLNLGTTGQKPNKTATANVTVLAGSTAGNFKLKDVSNNTHLHFSEASDKLYFDRCGTSCGTGDEFQLYTPSENAADSVFKGYAKVTNVNDIVAGKQYLIVKCTQDGSYYVMRPTHDVDAYKFVAKVVTGSTTIVIKGVGEGSTDVKVGETTYFIKVKNKVKKITLGVGESVLLAGELTKKDDSQQVITISENKNSAPYVALESIADIKSGEKYLIGSANYVVTNEKVSISGDPNGIGMKSANFVKDDCTPYLWTVKAVNGGYTLQDANGKYLNFTNKNGGQCDVTVGDTAQTITIKASQKGGFAITDGTHYFNNFRGDNDNVAGWTGDDNAWYLYHSSGYCITGKQVGTTEITVGNINYNITVVVKADKTALADVITRAEALVEADYVADSWASFKNVLADAKAVYEDADATQGAVNAAKTALETAIASLKTKPEDKPESKPVTEVFDDVLDGSWYLDAAQYVYDNGLMSGYGKEFTPNANMSRAMVVTTLYRMEGSPKVTDYSAYLSFKDVKTGDWYADAVAWALNNDIATGDPVNHKFNPNANVTREQLAAFLYRYTEFKGGSVTERGDLSNMKNADKVSSWALKEMQWAVGTELISGIAEVKDDQIVARDLAPQGNATRAQMATILQRYCQK